MDNFKRNPLILACIILLVICYTMNFVLPTCGDKLGLVPVNTIITNSYVWNLITCSFYEKNVFKLLLNVIGLLGYSTHQIKYLPTDQFSLFFLLSILSCSIGTSIWCFGRFFYTGIESFLLEPIYGFSGVFISLLLHARTQLQDTPIIAQFPSITFNNLPIMILLAQVILWAIGMKFLAMDILFSVVAILFSWSYLRFYIRREDGTLGENSEDFAFVNMFPETFQVVVVPLTTAFYNLAALLGFFPRIEQSERKINHHLRYNDPIEAVAPVRSVDVVSERRKAKAMKLLNAKLSELSKESEGWGDQDEDSEGVVLV